MRPTSLATALLTSGLLLTSHAQLIPFFTNSKPSPRKTLDTQRNHQQPMDGSGGGGTPGIQLPPSNNDNDSSGAGGDIILSDVLPTSRQTSIFASFCRDIDPVAARLDSAGKNTTVLAPLNSAISALPRKPWEDPEDYKMLGADAYGGKEGEDRAHTNLRRFVQAHVLPVSPWAEGERVRSLGSGDEEGREVWWESDGEGARVIMPGRVRVKGVVQRVKNGEVWVLEGVVDYKAEG